MSNNTKALKSGIWYTFSNFLVNGIGLITTPIFTRLMSHAEFGGYSNYASWLSIFTLVSTLNLETSFVSARFDYKDRFDQYVFSSLALSSFSILIWTLIINCLYVQLAPLFNLDRIYINCMMGYLLLRTAVQMYQVRERYYYEYKKSVLVSLIVSVSTAAVSVLLVAVMNDKLTGRILGSVIPTSIVGCILYLILLHRGKAIDPKFWIYAIPICIPYIPHLLSMTLLGNMDRIMITRIVGKEETALYTLAYNCGAVVTILLTSLNTAFTPWLGEKLFSKAYSEIRQFSKRYILCFLYLALGIMLLTPELLMILGGYSYMGARSVMPPVTCSIVFQFLYTLFVNVEQYNKKTIGMAIGSVTAALLNYLLNIIFIPRYGYVAAAYTTLASYFWLLVVHMYLVKKIHFSMVYDYRFTRIIVLIILVVTVAVNLLYKNDLARFTACGIYLLATCLVLFFYRSSLKSIYYMLRGKSSKFGNK